MGPAPLPRRPGVACPLPPAHRRSKPPPRSPRAPGSSGGRPTRRPRRPDRADVARRHDHEMAVSGTRDGAQVETVLMRIPTRATVCVSSQAGCAMGCTFCATGQAGFERHLDEGEIVEQVLRAAHASPQPVTNVVFMGMGEPLANYDPAWAAVHRLHDDVGISARRITISTVGVVPGIDASRTRACPSRSRSRSMQRPTRSRPSSSRLNRRYPIADVLDAAAEYRGRARPPGHLRVRLHRRRQRRAAQAGRARPPARRVPRRGRRAREPDPAQSHRRIRRARARRPSLRAFADRLRAHGVHATVRRNRGVDIAAACGQLRAREPIPGGRRRGAQWNREQVKMGQPVPAPDALHRDVPALHQRLLRADHPIGVRPRDRGLLVGRRARPPVAGASPTRSGGATPSPSSAPCSTSGAVPYSAPDVHRR